MTQFFSDSCPDIGHSRDNSLEYLQHERFKASLGREGGVGTGWCHASPPSALNFCWNQLNGSILFPVVLLDQCHYLSICASVYLPPSSLPLPLSPSPPLPPALILTQILTLIRFLTEKLWLEGKKNGIFTVQKSVNCILYIFRWSIYSWPNWYFFILLLVHVYQKQEIPILVELQASNIFAFTYSATVLTHKLFFNKILCM